MTRHQTFTIDDILNLTEEWLVTGKLNIDMLSTDFQFNSPFWQGANREEFIRQFGNSKQYKEVALSKIVDFSQVVKLKSADNHSFAVIIQYRTKNNSLVDEAVFGRVSNNKLVELRSIYDLSETKKALELN